MRLAATGDATRPMKAPKHPFPFPEPPASPPAFPASVDPATPISELASWWLDIECDCPHFHGAYYPLRLLSAQLGWRTAIGKVLDRLKCRRCGRPPVQVTLAESTSSGPGATRAPQRLLLRRYRQRSGHHS